MDIPDDLREFLAIPANRCIDLPRCQVREVTLCAPEELVERGFTVKKNDRSSLFRGVDLVKACKNYSPKGVFVWFPELELYGQWDCDHHKIMVFPGATWTDIAKEPERYFDGQWEPAGVAHRYLRPSENE